MNYIISPIKNIIEYISEHKLRYMLITIIFCIAIIFFNNLPVYNISKDGKIEEQLIMICGKSLPNWSIIFAIIAIPCAGVWKLFIHDKEINYKQQEKGADIARYFSEELLIKCSIVGNVFRQSNLIKQIDIERIPYYSFKNFTTNEIREIYQDDDFIDKYKSARKDEDFNNAYYRELEKRISLDKIDINKKYTTKEARELFILNNKDLPFKFQELIYDVLNELEHISMNISSQAAGSKYIYQSLHQMYIRTVRILAVEISMHNKLIYSDKFYTNIIYVYNQWTMQYKKSLKLEKNKKIKSDKILNPKIKTV